MLGVFRADDFDHAVEIANGVRFGLSSSIFTKDFDRALRFIQRTEVGLTHVNLHTAYKEPQASFGGTKLSGTGLPEAGRSGVEFFTRHRMAYFRTHQRRGRWRAATEAKATVSLARQRTL